MGLLGVRVLKATEVNGEGAAGFLTDAMFESYAEYYSWELSEKTARGMAQSAKNGTSTGTTPPYGYKWVEKKLVVDDTQAPVAKMIFDWYADGWSKKQIAEQLNKDVRNKCFIAYMLDCGLRRGELPKINLGDVDIKNKTTMIKGKGGKQRLVPMGSMSAALLNDYITRFRSNATLTSPLFTDNNNERCSDNLIKQLFKRLKVRSGIKRLHPHLLRHTFATYYIADGGDLETLRLILGHANIQTTQRYLHMAFNLNLQRSRHTSHIDKLYNK